MPKPPDKEVLDLLAELNAQFGKKKRVPATHSGSFPGYEDIEEPLLCLILFHGGPEHAVRASDAYRPLADFFGLSDSQRHEVLDDDTGRPKWNNMVQWARRKLNERGFLSAAGYGVWKLSDKGLMAAQRIQSKYTKLK